MANIFADGEELLNKKDFDKKVNINMPIYGESNKDHSNIAEYFNQNVYHGNGIQVIHETYQKYANILGMAGDNVRSTIRIPLFGDHLVGVSCSDQNNTQWSENIAWKSDIEALQNQINDLKKQIGGTK